MEELIVDNEIHKWLGFTVLSREDVERRKAVVNNDKAFQPKAITLEEARAAMQKCKNRD